MKASISEALEARVAQLESILKKSNSGDSLGVLNPTNETEGSTRPDAPDVTEGSAQSGPHPVSQLAQQVQNVLESEFVPADEAANALESISLVKPEQGTVAASSQQLDLGMEGWVPLVSLDAEHKLLAHFWDWQRMHLPYVAPVPFLSAYAIQSEAAHPDEPIPPPPPPPPPNPFTGPSAIGVPRAASIDPTPDLYQFISPLLLDTAFAIAALFTGDPETSEMFYRRAETRVLSEAANPRLATVQAMLIMATWELGHARAPATWTLLGVACALCVRLGMNVDATPLVRSGIISKRLFETRNFVFWATYNLDRFSAICMGMHPLMDKHRISTPRHSSLASANVLESAKPTDAGGSSKPTGEQRPTASDTAVTWWNPQSLGLDDIIIQAAWEAIRDLIRMSDMLLDGIYSFNAPKRNPQEVLELVTRNNLAVQRFLDELPTWLRSTGAIRRKENGLVYLHLFTHLISIVVARPFLSPWSVPEEAMHIDAGTDVSQPNHSSHIIRRYRTLAFRVARASALQITSLIRHIPLSSPCVTLPYVVYSACTVLLLAPDDPAAMDGVRTGITCLECMDKTGYWVISAKDAGDRIRALAERWGVNTISGRKTLGHIDSGNAGKRDREGGPGTGGSGAGPSTDKGDSQGGSQNTSLSVPSTGGNVPPSGSAGQSGNQDSTGQPPISTPATSTNISSSTVPYPQEYIGVSSDPHVGFQDANYIPDQNAAGPPSYKDALAHQIAFHPNEHGAPEFQGYLVNPTPYVLATGLTQLESTNTYVQPHNVLQHPERTSYSGQPQATQYQQPVQHIHYHFHSHTHYYPGQYHSVPHNIHYQPNRLPHVAYATSHSDPQHDPHLGHNHWHPVLPPMDPNLPFPPDPTACTDIAVCFADTVRTGQDPPFIQEMVDPYAGVVLDWLSDSQDSFAPIMSQFYGAGGTLATGSASMMAQNVHGLGLYTQGSQGGSNYGDYNAAYNDHAGYGVQR